MAAKDTYLAVFLGSRTSPRMKAWQALSDTDRHAKEREGIAAWKSWVEIHRTEIVEIGGPLGKTRKVSQHGVEEVSNELSAFVVVRADSHESAAKLFENHPHFTIFPGDGVEVMPILPVPGG